MPDIREVEIFSVGTWKGSRKVTVDSRFLDDMIYSFNMLNAMVPGFEAPLKIGHNDRVGEPAYGWVDNLRRDGDKIVADFVDVPDAMIDAIKKRHYNTVSVEVYPTVEYAGDVFRNVLGAVALLGAEWPAVKGLKPLSASQFAEMACEKIELNQKEVDMPTFTQEQHDAILAIAVTTAKSEMQALIDASESRATAEAERADRAEAALNKFMDESLDREIESVIDAAIYDGRILPGNKGEMIAIASVFRDKASSKVKFGDKEVTALELFKSYVGSLPQIVILGEMGRSKAETESSASEEVDTKAKARMAADKSLSYSQAVSAVFSEDADLKTRYAEEN